MPSYCNGWTKSAMIYLEGQQEPGAGIAEVFPPDPIFFGVTGAMDRRAALMQAAAPNRTWRIVGGPLKFAATLNSIDDVASAIAERRPRCGALPCWRCARLPILQLYVGVPISGVVAVERADRVSDWG